MRVWYRNLDWSTVLVWMLLVGVGLLGIYSSTHGSAAEFLPESVRMNFWRQIAWLGVSVLAVVVALLLPTRFYTLAAYPAYVFSLLLLLAALLFGTEINGAKSWLRFGPANIQVAEFAKVGTVLAVAQLIASKRVQVTTLGRAMIAAGMALVPAALVVLQNDAGSAMVFVALIPVLLFWSGLPIVFLIMMITPPIAAYLFIVAPTLSIIFVLAVGLTVYVLTKERWPALGALLLNGGAVAVVGVFLSRILQPYQVARLLSFTNPEAEEFRYTVGFHLVQSKAAIGSGGLMGSGFMEGTQTQGAYIPEQYTDFVFSAIGEEFGFVGAMIVIGLFAYLMVRLTLMGSQMKHPFGMMVAAGTVGIYLIHVFVNIGMTTGILPRHWNTASIHVVWRVVAARKFDTTRNCFDASYAPRRVVHLWLLT